MKRMQVPAYPFWPAQYAMNFLQPPPQSVPCHGYSGIFTLQKAGNRKRVHSQLLGPRFEPPGQYIDGHFLEGQGWSYIAPKEHTTINFVSNGLRPCDHGGGYYPFEFPFTKHKVPSDMTVRKLLERLGCPDGAQKGVTELILLGNDLFAAGDSFTQGGETSKRTLGEVGWGNESEVWLVVKRR